MADPIVPNFINGVGRLATDRYTYEKHVVGEDDRHKASQIDLFPTIVIGATQTTVQDAIAAISTAIGTPPPDASTTVKGIVKLAGDIAGTATNVVVVKLQGKPVSSLTPSFGDVLTWDGSVWKAQSISGIFTNLSVSGNTTLGTNSGNTLVVNAQATLSNNLTVNGNTVLGNAGSDSTTIQGSLNVSGGNVSIVGATGATFAATASVNINGALSTTITGGSTLSLNSAAIGVNSSGTLSLSSAAGTTITATGGMVITALYQVLNTHVQLNSPYGLTLNSGSSLYVYSGVNITMNSSIVMSGYSKINKRFTSGPNSNADIYPAQYDTFFASNITGSRQWTINESFGATISGIEFDIINYNLNYSVAVYSPSPFISLITTVSPGMRAVISRLGSIWALKHKHYIYT